MSEINYNESLAGRDLTIKNSDPALAEMNEAVQMLVSNGVKLDAIVGALKKEFAAHFQGK